MSNRCQFTLLNVRLNTYIIALAFLFGLTACTEPLPDGIPGDGNPDTCAVCHENPPGPPHTVISDCFLCHSDTVNPDNTIKISDGFHNDGIIQTSGIVHPTGWDAAEEHGYSYYNDTTDCQSCHGSQLNRGTSGISCDLCHTNGTDAWRTTCTFCHGGSDNATGAPPEGVRGEKPIASSAVGLHSIHVQSGDFHSGYDCSICHSKPEAYNSLAHIDVTPGAEVTFTALAGPDATYGNGTCSAIYCHGNGITASIDLSWVSNTPQNCDSCHGNPPPSPHTTATQCYGCHSQTVNPNNTINVSGGFHIDGIIQGSDTIHPEGWEASTEHGYAFYTNTYDCTPCHGATYTGGTSGVSCDECHTNGTSAWRTDCTFCHGGSDNLTGAPPKGVLGQTTISSSHVGLHSVHVQPGDAHTGYDCSTCHTTPLSFNSPGHLLDGTSQAEVSFSPLAGSNAAYSVATCTAIYCHGNGRTDSPAISWVTENNQDCNACHPYNRLSGEHSEHIFEENYGCVTCHRDVINSSDVITNKSLHINGTPDVSMSNGTYSNGNCSNLSCHGSEHW